jgi:uncharacterized small protein (DUF1192 family)
MDIDELFKPGKIPAATIGENLALLSVDELEARLTMLGDERGRVEAEIAARKASREAAEGFFKR